MNGIINYHDAGLAMSVGNNGLFNKPILPSTFSGCTGSSVIPTPLPVMSSCCCGGGSIYGGYGGYCGGIMGLSVNNMTAFGPKSFYSADTTQSFNNYSEGISWGNLFDGGFKSMTMGAFEGLTGAVSNPTVALNLAGAGLNGVGSLFSNVGTMFS